LTSTTISGELRCMLGGTVQIVDGLCPHTACRENCVYRVYRTESSDLMRIVLCPVSANHSPHDLCEHWATCYACCSSGRSRHLYQPQDGSQS
jgi:hypothetical protein